MTKMTKKEIIDIIQTLKDLSLTKIVTKTRSYVNKCDEINTFKELKQLIRTIKYSNQQNNVVNLTFNKKKGLSNYVIQERQKKKERISNVKENLPKYIWYVQDQKTLKIYRFYINSKYLQKELNNLGIISNIIVKSNSILYKKYKKKYKKQFEPKANKNKKTIKIDTTKATKLDKHFVKGNEKLYSLAFNIKKQRFETSEKYIKICLKSEIIFKSIKWRLIPREFKQYLTREKTGWILSEKGKQQQQNCYYYTTIKGKIIKKSKILTLIDTTITDYSILSQKYKSVYKPLTAFSKGFGGKQDKKPGKNKSRHQKMLKAHKTRIKRRGGKKNIQKKTYVLVTSSTRGAAPKRKEKILSQYKIDRQQLNKKRFEEKELKLANHTNSKQNIKLIHKSHKGLKRHKDLKGYYSYKKLQKHYNKLKERENGTNTKTKK